MKTLILLAPLLVHEWGTVTTLHEPGGAQVSGQGLFPDEAEAMLATWDAAYFKRPGTRVFYVVPRPWIDTYVPLTISTEAQITRAFIGRIDLQGG